jgi:transcriptional regulator with XRE-family HTH domain
MGLKTGVAIQQAREKAGFSRRSLGKRISPENPESGRRKILFWETGQREPSKKNREAIAMALGLPASTFNGDNKEGERRTNGPAHDTEGTSFDATDDSTN